MAALGGALRQVLPDAGEARAEFAIDGVPYVFRAEEDSPSLFVYAVLGALPRDAAARSAVYAALLHAQFCFSESCGFSFGVDADDSFVLLQALVDTGCVPPSAFAALMDKFVKAANVWSQRLAKAVQDGQDAAAEAAADAPEGNRRQSLPPSLFV